MIRQRSKSALKSPASVAKIGVEIRPKKKPRKDPEKETRLKVPVDDAGTADSAPRRRPPPRPPPLPRARAGRASPQPSRDSEMR